MQDLFGSGDARLRVLLDASVQVSVVLPQAFEMDHQFLQVGFELQVGLLDLLVVMLVHLGLPIGLLNFFSDVGAFEVLRPDGVFQISAIELGSREFLLLLDDILLEGLGKGFKSKGGFGESVSFLLSFGDLVVVLLNGQIE